MLQMPAKPLSVKQTADFFGCSTSLIYKMIKAKELPVTRLGDKYFIPARVVEALADGREVEK